MKPCSEHFGLYATTVADARVKKLDGYHLRVLRVLKPSNRPLGGGHHVMKGRRMPSGRTGPDRWPGGDRELDGVDLAGERRMKVSICEGRGGWRRERSGMGGASGQLVEEGRGTGEEEGRRGRRIKVGIYLRSRSHPPLFSPERIGRAPPSPLSPPGSPPTLRASTHLSF